MEGNKGRGGKENRNLTERREMLKIEGRDGRNAARCLGVQMCVRAPHDTETRNRSRSFILRTQNGELRSFFFQSEKHTGVNLERSL